jgi:hypothetical protein
VEASTGVKGLALLKLLAIPDCSRVLYFDPDIVILSSLDELLRHFESASILLTPHLTAPAQTREEIVDNELSVLKYGIYNLGFLGVRNSPEGRRFAQWWASRLEHFCYWEASDAIFTARWEASDAIFTDQRWVDHVPAYFDEVRILRDPIYNVCSWNLTHRTVKGNLRHGLTVDGRPIVFYHFSGLDRGEHQATINKYAPQMRGVHELQDWYLAECDRMGQRELGSMPWRYSCFDNGQPITWLHRERYRERPDLQQAFPNPFSTADIDCSYCHWFEANDESRQKPPESLGSGAADVRVAQLSEQLAEAGKRIGELENSWSWRLSAPLRVVGAVLRRAALAFRSAGASPTKDSESLKPVRR